MLKIFSISLAIVVLLVLIGCEYVNLEGWDKAEKECLGKNEGQICFDGACLDEIQLLPPKYCLKNPPGAPSTGIYCVRTIEVPQRCYFGCCNTEYGGSCRSNYTSCID